MYEKGGSETRHGWKKKAELKLGQALLGGGVIYLLGGNRLLSNYISPIISGMSRDIKENLVTSAGYHIIPVFLRKNVRHSIFGGVLSCWGDGKLLLLLLLVLLMCCRIEDTSVHRAYSYTAGPGRIFWRHFFVYSIVACCPDILGLERKK